MDKPNFLNKMKKLDIALLIYWVFFIIFYIITVATNQIIAPLYFDIIIITTNIVVFSIIIKSIKNKSNMISSYEEVVKLIYDEQYEKLEEMNGNEFYDLTSFLVTEMNKSAEELNKILKLVRSISREGKSVSINTKNKDTKYIIRFIQGMNEELKNTHKINTEFFKNVKTGKYNNINIDCENVVEQQLNKVLTSMYVMNTNLKNVQGAIFKGEYKIEILTEGIIGDASSIVNKINTLLKSSEKATNNLNEAIKFFESKDFLENTQPIFKGNLISNFKSLENLYNNINESINEIALALENDSNVDAEKVCELFKPIVNIINGIENDEQEVVAENIYIEPIDDMIDTVKAEISEENNIENFENTENYHTVSSNLILDIENELKSLKDVMANNDAEESYNNNHNNEEIINGDFELVDTQEDLEEIINEAEAIALVDINNINDIKKDTEQIIKKTFENRQNKTLNTEYKNRTRGGKVNKTRKEKKPITYQDMLKEKGAQTVNSTQTVNTTATHQTKGREATSTQRSKQPITYQRYLEKEKPNESYKSNESFKPSNVANNKPKSSVNNKKLREGFTREEKNELELYGEILDYKTRRDIAIITNEGDLGGF